ncbi:hypothetical protein N7G274_001224 [Stereocaulon virgatum]|uniref:Microsomal glutathione S-transferase 3 n=1 Tax=Stereocaulon virgatum TaxID=373712 RepID=A0ABR4APL7_9LECA
MSSLTVTIPREYGYVLLAATLSTLVGTYQSINVGTHRRAAKVPYPNAYASAAEAKESKDKYLFNCAQRAHGNFLEHQPQFLVGLLVGGVRYPVISASLGVAWCVSRVLYTWGYCRADKTDGSGRLVGAVGNLFELGLLVLSGMTGWGLMMG